MKFPLKALAFFLTTCATLCLTGCFSLECASPAASGEEHVVVRNYGWRLFYFFPVVCGNSDAGSSFPWVFFSNEVTMDNIQERFMAYAGERGKTPTHIEYFNYDTVMWAIPLLDVSIPVPYFLCYNEIQLSGRIK